MAKLNTLRDNFNDNVLDTVLWTTQGSFAETGGRAVLTATDAGSFIGGKDTDLDLTASEMVVRVGAITPQGTTGTLQSGIVLEHDASNYLGLRKIGGIFEGARVVGGVFTTVFEGTFSDSLLASRRWWRIRESGGTVFWEYGAQDPPITWTVAGSWVATFPLTSIRFYAFASFDGTEAAPGAFGIESVNPVLLRDVAGNPLSQFTSAVVTNNTPTVVPITASGAGAFAGSLTLTIIAAPTGAGLRDVAGNLLVGFNNHTVTNNTPATVLITASGSGTTAGTLALTVPTGSAGLRDVAGNFLAGFSNQAVTNNTVSTTLSLSASGLSATAGSLTLNRTLYLSASGYSGRVILYDAPVGYDEPTSYEGHPTAGDLTLTVVAPTFVNISISGQGFTTGGLTLQTVAPNAITLAGTSATGGNVALLIPNISLSAFGSGQTTGTIVFRGTITLLFSGLSRSTGTLAIVRVGSTWVFEPPIVYDIPPFTRETRGRILVYARHRPNGARGRTVLKRGNVYTLVDMPTVDEVNAADIAYLGGHVYHVSADEASSLQAAGFAVSSLPITT